MVFIFGDSFRSTSTIELSPAENIDYSILLFNDSNYHGHAIFPKYIGKIIGSKKINK